MIGRFDADLKGLSDKSDANVKDLSDKSDANVKGLSDKFDAKFDSSNRQTLNLTVALSVTSILFLIYMEVKGIVS